jgi:hypothetical protein
MPECPATAEQSPAGSSKAPEQLGNAPAPGRELLPKALLWTGLVIGVNSWTTHHLGWGLENPLGIASIAAGLGLVMTLAEKLLPKEEIESLKISLAEIPLAIVLTLLAVFVVVAAIRSSVTIISDSAGNSIAWGDVRLTGADTGVEIQSSRHEKKDEPLRFAVSTSPLGHLFRLKVPGYIGQVVQVYPVTGLTVIPERDLRISPSVLFRPPTNALQELTPKSGGRFQILAVENSGLRSLRVACNRSSYLFGTEHEIPATWFALWDLELRGSQISDATGDASATKLAWYRHIVLEPARDLAPGDVLEARVISGGGAVIAKARTQLGNEVLKDVALVSQTSPESVPTAEVSPCPKE